MVLDFPENLVLQTRPNSLLARFELFVDKSSDIPCWRWVGRFEVYGEHGSKYGVFTKNNGRYHVAHRASYWLYRGAIEGGLVIDHLCENKWCVNPHHLEQVTVDENKRRLSFRPKNKRV